MENDKTQPQKIFESTVSFVEARRYRGFIKATDIEDAKRQLQEAASKENFLSFNIDDVKEVLVPEDAYGDTRTVNPDFPDDDEPQVPVQATTKPTLN